MLDSKTEKTGVTIVIPTLNREKHLLGCLEDLINQNHRPIEILIVDQSDKVSGEVKNIVKVNKDIIVYHEANFKSLPMARNYGWTHARYNIIIFVDDDVRCGKDFVDEHLRMIQMPNVAIVGGGIDSSRKEKATKKHVVGFLNKFTATPLRGFSSKEEAEVVHVAGGNFSVWKEVCRKLGGFDVIFSKGASLYEETDFCLRAKKAGYKIYFNGKARIKHFASAEGGCRVNDIYDYIYGLARNRVILINRHIKWIWRPIAIARLFLLI